MERRKVAIKRLVLSSAVLVLAILVGVVALQARVARYDFLNTASYEGTTLLEITPTFQYAIQHFISNRSQEVLVSEAKREMAFHGWQCLSESNGHLTFKDSNGDETQIAFSNGASYLMAPELDGKTVVLIYRKSVLVDRFRAWLDRLRSRPSYGITNLISTTNRQSLPSHRRSW